MKTVSKSWVINEKTWTVHNIPVQQVAGFEGPVAADAVRALRQVAARLVTSEQERSPEALRFVRKALSLSAQDMARLCEVDPVTVSRWENGHRSIPGAIWTILRLLLESERTPQEIVTAYAQAAPPCYEMEMGA